MKTALLLSLLFSLLLLTAGLAWKKSDVWHARSLQKQQATPLPTTLHTQQDRTQPEQKSVLNLALPQNTLLMDPKITLPEKKSGLRNLFTEQPKEEESVKVGGRLILEEKPPEPNAAIWDQVKGAEVGITIKTP